MQRSLAFLLALVVFLLPFRTALALNYTDQEDLLTLDIEEDDDLLSYTDDEAYLPEDMRELAAASGLDARVAVRSYTPQDVLGYTLDIITCPLSGLTSHAADSNAARPVNSARATAYTDITAAEELKDAAVELVRSMYSDRFTLSAAKASSFQGVPALEIHGTGAASSHWTDYDCSIFLLTNTERLVIISAVYLRSDDDAMQTAVTEILGSISLQGSEPLPVAVQTTSAPERTSAPQQPASTQSAAPAVTEAPPSAGKNWQQSVREVWQQHPNLPYYLLLAVALLLLIVALILHRRAAARRQQWTLADEVDARIDLQTGGTRRNRSRKAKKTRTKEDIMGASDRPVGSGRREYDYTEDISRYTQQPSADVNDVSRYTHGYDEDDSLSKELKALQDEPLVTPPPVRIQSVGSRVERNRRRKRR